jgi:flagellar biosynthesis/type III secretory pathway chaperone
MPSVPTPSKANSQQDYEALIDLLEQEEAIYREMLALLDEEREAMLRMRVDQVMRLTSRKETLALRVKALDESRKMLARRLAAGLGTPPDQVTVTRLCEQAPFGVAKRLAAAGDRLRQVVAACKTKNEANGRTAACGMNVIAGAMDHLIAHADPTGVVYRPSRRDGHGGYARLTKAVPSLGLVSRQA